MQGLTGVVLRCLLLVGASRAAGSCGDANTQVLILGAGMAGVSAAKILSDANVTNFLILEAEEEIGGRVKNTILKHSGLRVELGANWIQGIDPDTPEKHPLWQIAQRCGGLDGQFVQTYNNGTMHVFDEHGRNITNSTDFKNRLQQWNKILDPGLAIYAEKQQDSDCPDMTAREALTATGWMPNSSIDDLIEWNGFDLDEYATSPEHVSLYENFPDDTYDDFGNNAINYFVNDQQEGFVKVVDCLAKEVGLPDHRLHLGNTVTEVDWSNSDCVCVNTEGRESSNRFCAPHALLTFSLGVLKSNSVKFTPDFPPAKKNAINEKEMSLYLKIFLEFEEIFWKGETYVDFFLRVDKTRGHFVVFQPVTKTAPVLFTTVTGELAKMVYSQTKEETTSQIMAALHTIYGEGIPEPLSVTIPDWWVNPLFYGTYSNSPVGVGEKVNDDLKSPLGGLHFCGEATSYLYEGYVHGGYYSGIDCAKEVLEDRTKFTVGITTDT